MAPRSAFHLVCNAHLDPVWLWEWEEGAAEAISTFRTAADLCEEFPGFIFCHNEVILYRWVEEYEPTLFRRIQKLVKAKKWHIMGGWHLQPDCTMPSGESFVRQMLAGRVYFREKFGVVPTTAIGFDAFGHTRGLVQIMVKAGYDSYLFCRPGAHELPLPDRTFRWVGLDGSSVMATRVQEAYLSPLGKAREKTEHCMKTLADRQGPDVILWGVGNHGGGPSRKDIRDLNALIAERKKAGLPPLSHSTPEAYFAALRAEGPPLPEFRGSLNPTMVGCYTSQVRIKQEHRALENDLYMAEKMAAAAFANNLMTYPDGEIADATRDLLTAEFHDILPGSSIQAVEDASLRMMAHGREILSRVRARAFFALASGQKKAAEGTIPVCVYNPHPWPLETVINCEFQLADQNWSGTFTDFTLRQGNKTIPCQVEKERSNLTLDWRKRLVFRATLAPSCMNRFDATPAIIPAKPAPTLKPKGGVLTVRTPDMTVAVNTRTGLVDRWTVRGMDMLAKKAFEPIVLTDDEDSWCMRRKKLGDPCGHFTLMGMKEGTAFSGLRDKPLPSVRVIEQGPVRTVIEAVLSYGASAICQRYAIPAAGTAFDVETRVYWMEKDRTLKLAVPSAFGADEYLGQIAFGSEPLAVDGTECVAQKWTALLHRARDRALVCVNESTYGSSFRKGAMMLTLLRSPAYSGHPIGDRPLVRTDGFTERIDQGERIFRFRFLGGTTAECLTGLDRAATAYAETPMALSFFPSGTGTPPKPLARMDAGNVVIGALKRSEDGKAFILRAHEPTGRPARATIAFPALGLKKTFAFGPFEIKTLRLNMKRKTLAETSLME